MGVIFTKDLVLIDPEDGIPVKTLLTVFNRKFLVTGCGARLREVRRGSERKSRRVFFVATDWRVSDAEQSGQIFRWTSEEHRGHSGSLVTAFCRRRSEVFDNDETAQNALGRSLLAILQYRFLKLFVTKAVPLRARRASLGGLEALCQGSLQPSWFSL